MSRFSDLFAANFQSRAISAYSSSEAPPSRGLTSSSGKQFFKMSEMS